MPKSKKKNDPGCCLVSILLWPVKLLERLIDEVIGKHVPARPTSRRRVIPNIPNTPQQQNQTQFQPQHQAAIPSKPQTQIQLQSQPQRERFVEVSPAGTSQTTKPLRWNHDYIRRQSVDFCKGCAEV